MFLPKYIDVFRPYLIRQRSATIGRGIMLTLGMYNPSTNKVVSMQDFVAIDFETANHARTSICSVGAVLVERGEIVGTYYQLVRPEPNYYHPCNIQIHGITRHDTARAATFDRVWEQELKAFIGGRPLVAHNKAFDESCLRATLAFYGIPYDEYAFYCTCQQARRVLGKRLPNHQLKTVSSYLGYDLQSHHHALADAEACAHIARILFAHTDK